MAANKEHASHGTKLSRCPICGRTARRETQPFCSRRCADIDLARWLGGGYVIAGGSRDADEDGDDAAAGAAGKREPEADE